MNRLLACLLLLSCDAAFADTTDPRKDRKKEADDKPLSAEEVFKSITTMDDIEIDLLASEPVVEQPSFLDFDERGRMWIVQYRQYPEPAGLKLVSKDKHWRAVYDRVPAPPGHPDFVPGKDQITIHEDTNGDGMFDKVKVFLDGLNLATSCVRGRGGVFVLQPPYLLFYADKNDDDVPDGDPEVLLQGFGIEDTHSIPAALSWGPDGWLYASQGSTVSSAITIPGSDAEPVRAIGQMMWRYHPDEKRYEIFAEGGGNIWSCEFDSKGRLFAGHNGGSPGFFYLQAAYYNKTFKKHGELSNPYAYGYFQAIAHPSFKRVTTSICVYEGGALPERYEGGLAWANPVIGRFGVSTLERDGLGFRSDYIDLPVDSPHGWFRPVYVDFGPDGALYFGDWYDRQVNHYRNYEGKISKKDGRLFRVRAKGAKPIAPFDLRKNSTPELVELLRHKNRWHRETARRLLSDRSDKGDVVPKLRELMAEGDGQLALEALWALNLCGVSDLEWLKHGDPYVRMWAVRLIGDRKKANAAEAKALLRLAKSEPELEVRGQLASAARRLPAEVGVPILEALIEAHDDSGDNHMPLMLWWAVETHCADDSALVVSTLGESNAPVFRKVIAENLVRRLASDPRRKLLLACATLFKKAANDDVRSSMLRGFEKAYRGRSMKGLPEELAKVLPDSLPMRVRRGDTGATKEVVAAFLDEKKTKSDARRRLLEAIADAPSEDLLSTVLSQLDRGEETVRLSAIAALAGYSDHSVGATVVSNWPELSAKERDAARTLLASRAVWSRQLAEAAQAGKIDPKSVPADAIADMRRHDNADLAKLIDAVWGKAASPLDAVFEKEIARVAKIIGTGGDPYAGRKLYLQRCGACHALHNEGGAIGPDLTAYQRSQTDDLLLAIVNPNAEIREGFETVVAKTKDGRTVSGFLADQDENVITLRPVGGQDVVIARDDLKELTPAGVSLMPPGLLTGMGDQELKDLFSYLRASQPLNL